MRFSAGALALLLTAGWLTPAQIAPHGVVGSTKKAAAPAPDPPPDTAAAPKQSTLPPSTEKLDYDVEWRLIHAGTVSVESQKARTRIAIDSAGMVSSLFRIHDTYSVNFDQPFCATGSLMDSQEGKRHHEATVTYNRSRNRATFVERDVLNGSIVHSNEVEIPNCVQDVITGMLRLRGMNIEPGQSAQIPMSDGRKTANVKVEAQEREEIKTPAGVFKAVRYEIYMMNGVVYGRKGRAFIWLSEDSRRLPVQIRVRLAFPIGTVTVQLQKEEKS